MRILADALVAGQTGLVARLEALVDRFNLSSRTEFNVKDDEYGAIGDGVADDSAAFIEAYTDAVAVGGGTVVVPKGTYRIGANLNWNSTLVSVVGAGSGVVTLEMVGTNKITVQPLPFVVSHGPTFVGFTVKGNATAGAKGIYCIDMVCTTWRDVAVRDFAGVGAVGVHLHNQTYWTERNHFGFTLANNKISLLATTAGGSVISYEYNWWGPLMINVAAGQVGIVSRDNAYIRGGVIELIANVTDDGVLMQIEGTSAWDIGGNIMAEQTGGTGGRGILQASAAFGHFQGTLNLASLTNGALPADTLPVPVRRSYGGSFYKESSSGLVYTPISGALRAIPGSRPPVIAMLAQAGESPPAAVIDATSDQNRGRFTVGTGTGPGTGQFLQVAWPDAHTVVPVVTLQPEGFPAVSAALNPSVFNVTVFGFWVAVAVAPAASQSNTTYAFSYTAMG